MLTLHDPDERFQAAFLVAAGDYVRSGETKSVHRYERALGDFAGYLRSLRDGALGVGPRAGQVPQSCFWLIEDQARLVGVSRLRPRLTPDLELDGGNIGYDVPPAERRKGYGTELLRLTLARARAAGLSRALLTVEPANIASIKIIERNGGRLEPEPRIGSPGVTKARYVIDLPA